VAEAASFPAIIKTNFLDWPDSLKAGELPKTTASQSVGYPRLTREGVGAFFCNYATLFNYFPGKEGNISLSYNGAYQHRIIYVALPRCRREGLQELVHSAGEEQQREARL